MTSTRYERILIITTGSRGDCQPYIALAKRLVAAGHETGMVTNGAFQNFVKEREPGCSFFPLEGDPMAILQSKEFEDAFFSGNTQKGVQLMLNEAKKYAKTNMKHTHEAVKEWKPTCLIGSIICLGETLALGQKYLIPVLCASTIPAYPSASMPIIGLMEKPIGVKWVNKGLSSALWKLQWAILGSEINRFRQEELGLPSVDAVGLDNVPILNMFSNTVVPRPDDYPPHVIDTGYWILPENEAYTPDPELQEYLESGSAPVYIGFGSMPVKDKQGILDFFSSALKKTGTRGLYSGGWSNVEGLNVPENIFVIKGAPHEWLFPRCAMAFHHGGAGTTAASLRAGIPTIILSVLIDQPYWSSRVVELGVGQDVACPLRDVTESYIQGQIEHCLKERVKEAAKQLATKLCSEDGAFVASSYVVSYAKKNQNPGIDALDYKPDSSTSTCGDCKVSFSFFKRRHHCMTCGNIYCTDCVKYFDIANYETFRYCCRACASLRNLNYDLQP